MTRSAISSTREHLNLGGPEVLPSGQYVKLTVVVVDEVFLVSVETNCMGLGSLAVARICPILVLQIPLATYLSSSSRYIWLFGSTM
ncbi:hypothetical protein N7508_007333 [Penicillium antarcticum]|uniref:uncharacterized protein n=1 Tax=Penicillium antarcticum TaxID=416450 RepID=UPI0023A01B4A|nr:uncharacterized protein N7508_007333 [Penicillium antarcticum]KAJ5300090.1 hypothetical protein N7508_007333 [Penicillium antarcticum]